MIASASQSSSPLDESPMATRRRLAQLARMVFEFRGERSWGGTIDEFDGVEDANLIAALRACGSYADRIGCLNHGEDFVIELKGIDGHVYLIRFSLPGPEFRVHAARVGEEDREGDTPHSTDRLQGHTKRLHLGGVTADRAFLVGMSLVIGFTDEEDEDADARLAPLLAQVMPTADELREIVAHLPPSSINYDEEGDPPF